jgi:glycosyltransferase involved in cell wall biosynthesis
MVMPDAAASVATEPLVSVVLPCRNEVSQIEQTLRSLLAQELPPGALEVIVADGRSDDGTRALLDRLGPSMPALRVVDNPGVFAPSGFNAGLRVARGRFVAILGSHATYSPDYLRRAVELLARRPDVDVVGGAIAVEGESRVERAVAAAFHHPFSVGGARWHDPTYEGAADTVFGAVYRREVFERIGPFDEALVRNQDDELNLRLTRSGGLIWHTPAMRSRYVPRGTLRQLFAQYRQYGYWKVLVIRKHRIPASPRHLVPGLFVAGLVGLAALLVAAGAVSALSDGSPTAGVVALSAGSALMAVAGVYAVAIGWAALQAHQGETDILPLLPAVFACIHVGYGVGFLEGVRDFVLLRKGPSPAKTRLTR